MTQTHIVTATGSRIMHKNNNKKTLFLIISKWRNHHCFFLFLNMHFWIN